MTAAILVLLVVLVVLVGFLLLQLRAASPATATILQQQLIEVRARLDALVEAQRELPTTVTSGNLEQARALADVRERMAQLTEVTRRLEQVGESVSEVHELLRVPKLRGNLGEVWLEELLRQVFPSSLYSTQYSFTTGERVDAVLRVGDRLVSIDAKFPLEACQRMAAGDDQDRLRSAFRRSLKQRIDEIAAKYIRPEEGTYGFAMMYVPAEAVYYEAIVRGEDLEDGASVMAYALNRRVIIVSPNTFYAYLVALLHGLRGLEVDQRAQEILNALVGVQQQVERFQRSFDVLGRHLEHAGRQHSASRRELQRLQDVLAQLGGVELSGDHPALRVEEGGR